MSSWPSSPAFEDLRASDPEVWDRTMAEAYELGRSHWQFFVDGYRATEQCDSEQFRADVNFTCLSRRTDISSLRWALVLIIFPIIPRGLKPAIFCRLPASDHRSPFLIFLSLRSRWRRPPFSVHLYCRQAAACWCVLSKLLSAPFVTDAICNRPWPLSCFFYWSLLCQAASFGCTFHILAGAHHVGAYAVCSCFPMTVF